MTAPRGRVTFPTPPPKSEEELCERFRAAAELDGWIAYPEVKGWDLVLVWSGEVPLLQGATPVEPGDQIAVEAKMRPNVEALSQAANRPSIQAAMPGPDFRAVLVPNPGDAFREVARLLRLGVFSLRHCGPWNHGRRSYLGPQDRLHVVAPPARRIHKSRLWLPPVVPQGPAGAPSPRPLTRWRVQAILLCARLRERGSVTTADFRELGIGVQVWLNRWIVRQGTSYQDGRPFARYVPVADPREPLPDVGFEADREALLKTLGV